MSKTAYENLEVYWIAEQISQIVYASVKRWTNFDRDTLGKQVVRAADSIGANIAEGFGRGTGADHKRFLRIARGSTYETKHWLRVAFTRQLLNQEEIDRLRPLIDKLPPKLNAYLNTVGRIRRSTIDNQRSPA